jgi:hypothetical protein
VFSRYLSLAYNADQVSTMNRHAIEEYAYMAAPIEIEATVSPDGELHIRVPGLIAGQRVRVSVAADETQEAEKRHAADILTEMPGHRMFTTAEEVDAYINEERDSWDR